MKRKRMPRMKNTLTSAKLKKIGRNIQLRRLKISPRPTQQAIAKKLKISTPMISFMESGKLRNVQSYLPSLAKELKTTKASLLK